MAPMITKAISICCIEIYLYFDSKFGVLFYCVTLNAYVWDKSLQDLPEEDHNIYFRRHSSEYILKYFEPFPVAYMLH